MYRCIIDSPVALAIDGVPHVISRATEDQPDGSPLVAAAPWAFEQVEGDPQPKRRGRPPKVEAAGPAPTVEFGD